MAFHMQGRLREAEQLCLKLLSHNPRNSKALYVAGRIASDAGDDSLAEQRYRQAVKESPREPQFLVSLGNVSRHDYESAIKLYLKALSVRPNMIEALSGLARAYVRTDRAEMALDLWQKILRLEPNHQTARLDLADALTKLDRIDEASAALRESISLRKAVGAAYSALAKTKKFAGEPVELNAIHTELESEKLESREASHLHYAAGKILNDLRRYDEAIEQFKRANLTSGQHFDIDAYRQASSSIIRAFSPSLLSSKTGFGDPTEVPVFVIGMPRSGTTLTEQICSSHPSVFGAGELRNFRRVAYEVGFGRGSPVQSDAALAAMTPERSRTLAAKYLGFVQKLAPKALRIVDKRPHNFELVGLIVLLFPNARIVHCRRDAIDTCISCFVTSFADRHGYKTDLTTLGLYYREYDRLMQHWNSVLPGRIHEVRYETLIADQETESRKLIDYLGLPWDDACLRFQDNDRAVHTASRWQVRQPIYTSSVKRWKNYEGKIQPLIEALGDLAET